jgi:hypothetical protein
MPDPNGAWIGPALDFSGRLAALPTSERAEAFAAESAARGLTILTLRRNMLAARYCESHAKSVGMAVEAVVAAALAVEILMRLERRDRAAANALRKPVFEGRMSVRAMRDKLKATPEQRPRGRAMGEWGSFALSMIEQFYSQSIKSFTPGENSDIGKLLKVDIEFCIEGDKQVHAIFVSPLDDYSECAGLTIDDQIPLILAASLFFPQVNVALYEPAEASRVQTVLASLPEDLSAKFRLLALYGGDDVDL